MIVETLSVFTFIASPCMAFMHGDIHSHVRGPESALVVAVTDVSLSSAVRASQTNFCEMISLCEIDNGSRAYLVMRGAIPFSTPV